MNRASAVQVFCYTSSTMIKKIILVIITVSLLAASLYYFAIRKDGSANSTSKTSTSTSTSANSSVPTDTPKAFNASLYDIKDPTSLWFVANKHFAMPTTYAPNDLVVLNVPLRLSASDQQMKIRTLASSDLQNLFTSAKTAGLQLEFGSGYRSAAYQKVLYDGYVSNMGRAEADRSSARPGHSEHQTGLALDFTRIDGKCHLEACFGDLQEGKWLAANAHLFGFILRYPSDKEAVTGYMYEPWHFRYVGSELANEMYKTGSTTLEEFFKLANANNYLN